MKRKTQRGEARKAKVRYGGAVRSMTGFGRARAEYSGGAVTVSLKVVNNRHLDLVFRLPEPYLSWEAELRAQVSSKLIRGRVEVTVQRELGHSSALQPNLPDPESFAQTFSAAKNLLRSVGIRGLDADSRLAVELLLRRDSSAAERIDESPCEDEARCVASALALAIDEVSSMRAVEGERHAADLADRLSRLDSIVGKVRTLSLETPKQVKQRLLARVSKLVGEVEIDQARFVQEVAYLCDRLDITEELVRLTSHCEQFRSTISTSGKGALDGVGKKLDFLLQEFGREFNTIGSKAQNSVIQNLVVEAKVELEKMREQVQNIV